MAGVTLPLPFGAATSDTPPLPPQPPDAKGNGANPLLPPKSAPVGPHGKPRFDPSAPPPAFLRGTALDLYLLNQELHARARDVIFGELVPQFGFDDRADGAAACGLQGLVLDLTGGGGPLAPTADDAIAMLHERVFDNYNQWARCVGAGTAYSVRYKDYLQHPTLAMLEAMNAGEDVTLAEIDMQPPAGAKPPAAVHAPTMSSISAATPVAAAAALVAAAEAPEDAATAQPDEQQPDTGEVAGDGQTLAAEEGADGLNGAGVGGLGIGIAVGRGGTASTEATLPEEAAGDDGTGVDDAAKAGLEQPEAQFDDDAAEPNGEEAWQPNVPGCDAETRLADLCLWYTIRAEAANLRFMPE